MRYLNGKPSTGPTDHKSRREEAEKAVALAQSTVMVSGEQSTSSSYQAQRYPSLPDSRWKSISLDRLDVPTISIATMATYFIDRKVFKDNKAAADFASISEKSYRLFKKGHGQKIEVSYPGGCCASGQVYFRAKIYPEMKDKMYPTELVFVRSDDGSAASVSWAKCGCPSGKGIMVAASTLQHFFMHWRSFASWVTRETRFHALLSCRRGTFLGKGSYPLEKP